MTMKKRKKLTGMSQNEHDELILKSKNYRNGRVKSACSGFGRITTFGNEAYGPTHFSCGPGFKKI